MGDYTDGLWLVRVLLQRGLAALYLVAFAGAVNQFPALLGENGLLPARPFLRRVGFRRAPSLFHWRFSDGFARKVGWAGVALSLVALSGLSEKGPVALSAAIWLAMWFLYLSFVNAGQTFYAFGWESVLLR